MRRYGPLASALFFASLLIGCAAGERERPEVLREVPVTRTALPVTVDGIPDEPAWRQAVPCRMVRHNNWKSLPPRTRDRVLADEFQTGRVRLLYDRDFLYLAVEFEDSDVIAGSMENQTRLYRTGDLAELFLSPAGGHGYFEIYVNPVGAHTCYVFPGGGAANLTMMFDVSRKVPGICAAARVDGTLNDHSDRDRGWSAEIAVPRKILVMHGNSFASGTKWNILVTRYNYASHLRKLQFSGIAELPDNASYGDIEYHIPVRFRDAPENGAVP